MAEVFGKRHDNVLATIQTVDCSEEFNLLNFKEIEYLDSRGRLQRSFDMTKDGFTFLVMGFTGSTAGRL